MLDVLIYSEHSSNRFQYVLDWIFKGVSSFQITHDVDLAIKYNGPIIFYSNKYIRQDALRIPDSGYLWYRKSEPVLPDVALVTFPLNNLDVDIFSFIFYSLARCEEYNKSDLDAWGRFKAENSVAFKNNYLQIPYVDLVKVRLFDFLKEKWPSFMVPLPIYKRQISYDIDVAWAYLYRSLPRHFYGICRDVLRRDFSSIYHRWQVLTDNEVDPYFTFSRILTTHATLGDQPIFFWLMGNKSKIDRAVGLKSKAFKQLIRDVSSKYNIGLHPSMKSGLSFEWLQKEYNFLCSLAEKKIIHSRQHYLLLNMPDTYRNLVKIGVENDYSMGYASQCGFRAGTCFPFLWFDEQRDVCTNLTIHPFQAMDVTFWVYGENTSEGILATLENIENQCKSVGGIFTFIAHNSSFSGPGTWKAWEEIYFTFLKKYKYMITIIHDTPSIAGNYLAELRDVTVQQNKVLFRRNIQRLGVFMAYELSKHLSFEIKKIQTPLGIADCTMVNTPIVLGTILRAGLPMHQGFLDVFDDAENAFLTAFRKHHGSGKFDIEMEYVSCPDLTGKCLVLIDPMLATGASIIKAVEHLAKYGTPSSIHIVSAIASKEGMNQVHQKLPQAHIWIGDVDDELTAKSYIVPGLGDAGDLSFGEKCQD